MWLEARIVGVMKFEDDGEVDDKIVVVPADNRDQGDLLSLWMTTPCYAKIRAPLLPLQRPQNLAPPKLWAGVMQKKLSQIIESH